MATSLNSPARTSLGRQRPSRAARQRYCRDSELHLCGRGGARPGGACHACCGRWDCSLAAAERGKGLEGQRGGQTPNSNAAPGEPGRRVESSELSLESCESGAGLGCDPGSLGGRDGAPLAGGCESGWGASERQLAPPAKSPPCQAGAGGLGLSSVPCGWASPRPPACLPAPCSPHHPSFSQASRTQWAQARFAKQSRKMLRTQNRESLHYEGVREAG